MKHSIHLPLSCFLSFYVLLLVPMFLATLGETIHSTDSSETNLVVTYFNVVSSTRIGPFEFMELTEQLTHETPSDSIWAYYSVTYYVRQQDFSQCGTATLIAVDLNIAG